MIPSLRNGSAPEFGSGCGSSTLPGGTIKKFDMGKIILKRTRKAKAYNINIELSGGKKCVDCGRSYPDTILNIEATIHHGSQGKPRCIDRKNCERIKRKQQKKVKKDLGY
jgi:hypothetical protein